MLYPMRVVATISEVFAAIVADLDVVAWSTDRVIGRELTRRVDVFLFFVCDPATSEQLSCVYRHLLDSSINPDWIICWVDHTRC